MKKAFSLPLLVVLLLTACSKKNGPGPVALLTIPTVTATVSTVAGSGSPGADNGFGNTASFNLPIAIAVDGAGNIYVADLGNNLVRKININGIVTTLAGSGAEGAANGAGSNASFSAPSGIAVDAAGNAYVADYGNNLIRKISPGGVVTTLAGSGAASSADGMGTAASFFDPTGIATDAAGNVYVADYGNKLVRKITPQGLVTTLAGADRDIGYFDSPTGITVDAAGNVYVADYGNDRVVQVTTGGQMITVAYLYYPSGLALRADGSIYAALPLNNQVWQINSVRISVPFAGSGIQGADNGLGSVATFYSPSGIAADAAGNIYIADSGNNLIRKIVIK